MPIDTAVRVERNTADPVNRQIRRIGDAHVAYCAEHPEHIDERLRELDREWDIERAIEANAATLALAGSLLTATRGRKWVVLPLVVTSFLLQHAVQGWCPPVPVLRRLGFRTQREIHQERAALKALRGDFASVGEDGDRAAAAIEAAAR